MAKKANVAGGPRKRSRPTRSPVSKTSKAKAPRSRRRDPARMVAAAKRAEIARIERERTNRAREFDRRITPTKATKAAGRRTPAAEGTTEGRRLRILAEGDSWFDYPFEGGGVISRLQASMRADILNLAHHGDEARHMLGLKQRRRIIAELMNTRRMYDAVLFSGGGNDIVGDTFCLWLRDRDAVSGDASRAINESGFTAELGVITHAYEELISIRDEACRATPGRRIVVFLHAYDWAIPNGSGVCPGIGPWLKPSLDDRGWTSRAEARVIVRTALERFARALGDLAARHSDVILIPTQGVLGETQWHNELHPNGTGFAKVARLFQQTIEARFPASFP